MGYWDSLSYIEDLSFGIPIIKTPPQKKTYNNYNVQNIIQLITYFKV